MSSNSEIEMRWVGAWNDIYDLANELNIDRSLVKCQLPNWSVVSLEVCLGWIQESVYSGFSITSKIGWIGHNKGLLVERVPVANKS